MPDAPSAPGARSAPPTPYLAPVYAGCLIALAAVVSVDAHWGDRLPVELLYLPVLVLLAWHGARAVALVAAVVAALLPFVLHHADVAGARHVSEEVSALRAATFVALVLACRAARTRWRTLLAESHADPLTGLAHHGAFLDAARHELARQLRHGGSTSVLVLDLDGFKALNDGHGHAAGDRALVGVAQALVRTLRGGDVVARIGGDEFAVLLAGTDAAAAVVVREHVRAALAAWATAERLPLGFSLGAATAGPGHALAAADLVARADREMYREKERHHAETGAYARQAWPAPRQTG
jgi:diguanylate cyclase (GGDEF)-like protein